MRQEPRIFRLLAINGLAGGLLGIAFVLGILGLDIARIRTMVIASGEWAVPIGLLTMGSIVTFASVAMGGAIMLMPRGETDRGDRGRGRRVPASGLALARIPVRRRA